MTNRIADDVETICYMWVHDGRGDECFWEGWPDCPSPQDDLTPNMVLEAMKVLRDGR